MVIYMSDKSLVLSIGTPPFPDPATVDETKQNLTYYRRRAGYSQRTASRALQISQANYWAYEIPHATSDKASDLPFHLLETVATTFNCPPDLIDPACPYNKEDPAFRAISCNNQILRCIPEPVTDADYTNNFNYFLALSRMPVADIAEKSHMSPSAINKWRAGSCSYRGHNILRVLDAIGFLEFRELCVKPGQVVASGEPVTLDDGSQLILKVPAKSIPDLKSNLKYHMHAQGFKAYQLDMLLHVQPGTARRWLDPSSRFFMTPEQARVVATMYRFSPADISTDALLAQTGFTPVTEALPDLRNNRSLLSMPVKTYASGTPAVDYPAAQSDDTVAEYFNVHSGTQSLRCARVVGDSMFNYDTGEGIPEGSLVLVDVSVKDPTSALNRVVCWLTADNEILIKRLRRVKGVLYLCSDNPATEPNMYPVPTEAVLLGVVIGAMFKV